MPKLLRLASSSSVNGSAAISLRSSSALRTNRCLRLPITATSPLSLAVSRSAAGKQQTALPVHLHHLAVKFGDLQELLLDRMRVRGGRQLALDLLPFLHGINFGNSPRAAGDVELDAIVLVDLALEVRRHLEAPFFVQSSCVRSDEHTSG